MTRRRAAGPLVFVGKPIPANWGCHGCKAAPAMSGDVYCQTCRTAWDIADRLADAHEQMSFPILANDDPGHTPGQLDLGDALNEGATDHA